MAANPNDLDQGFASTAALGAEGGLARQQARAKPAPAPAPAPGGGRGMLNRVGNAVGMSDRAEKNTRGFLDDLGGELKAAGRGIAKGARAVGNAIVNPPKELPAPRGPTGAQRLEAGLERLNKRGIPIGMSDRAEKNTRGALEDMGRPFGLSGKRGKKK